MVHNIDSSALQRDALSQLLWVTSLMSADLRHGLAGFGLTEARAHALWELGASDKMTQRELADALKVSPRNVTTLVDALEETGFVSRTAHATDRRATTVVLTEKGRKTVLMLQSQMTEFAERLFGPVSERDLRVFRRVLGAIGTRLSELSKAQTEERPAGARKRQKTAGAPMRSKIT